MDVLEYWRPDIAWSDFDQGPISDEVWDRFKQVVQLCHAFCHWEEDAQHKRLSPPKQYLFPPEDKRQFKKRQDEWKADIRRSESHRNRARYLADTAVAELSYLGTNAIAGEAEGTADWKLWFALRIVVNAYPPAAALKGFKADQELEGEANEIPVRWLRQAGYSI